MQRGREEGGRGNSGSQEKHLLRRPRPAEMYPLLFSLCSFAKTKLKADNRPIVKIPQEPKIHDSNCHFGWKNKSNKGRGERVRGRERKEDQDEFQSHSMVGFPRDEMRPRPPLPPSLPLSLICGSFSSSVHLPSRFRCSRRNRTTTAIHANNFPRNSRGACGRTTRWEWEPLLHTAS